MNTSEYIINGTAENLPRLIERSHAVPVLVDFWASWCQPCQVLLPIVEKLAQEMQGKFLLVKVNIDEQQALATQFAVRSVPTVKLLRNGQIVDEFAGALPESQVREFIDRHLPKPADALLNAAAAAWAAGDAAQAEAFVRQAREEFPDDPRSALMLAEILAAQGQSDEASRLLAGLPADLALSAEAQALHARLAFASAADDAPDAATLQAALDKDPSDSQSRHHLAARLVLAGELEGALENLLELMRRDRRYGDDAARKGILQIFELLGGEGELVTRYRRAMASLLH